MHFKGILTLKNAKFGIFLLKKVSVVAFFRVILAAEAVRERQSRRRRKRMASSSYIETFSHSIALSARESEILELVKQGYSVKLISENLFLSPNTVKTHVRNIYLKAGVSSRDELMKLIDRERER